MKQDTIKATLAFLSRVNLQGSEVPAFNKVVEELQAELEPKKEDKK